MQCSVQQISKRFGKNWILKDIELEIQSGERLALLGRNGSGKSTFLRILAGQLSPSKGSITYRSEGSEIDNQSLYRHLVIIAPYVDLYRQMTLKEALDFHFQLSYYK